MHASGTARSAVHAMPPNGHSSVWQRQACGGRLPNWSWQNNMRSICKQPGCQSSRDAGMAAGRSAAGRAVLAAGSSGGGSSALPCSCCAYCDSIPWLRPLTAGWMADHESEHPLQLPCGNAIPRSCTLTGVPSRLSNPCSGGCKAGRRSARAQTAVLVWSGGPAGVIGVVQQRKAKFACIFLVCNCDGPPE